jgi:hypothetical protein
MIGEIRNMEIKDEVDLVKEIEEYWKREIRT